MHFWVMLQLHRPVSTLVTKPPTDLIAVCMYQVISFSTVSQLSDLDREVGFCCVGLIVSAVNEHLKEGQ